jgi:hypothetical protein
MLSLTSRLNSSSNAFKDSFVNSRTAECFKHVSKYLSKKFIQVSMLRKAFCKLIVMLDKTPDIYTTEGIGLRKWKGERERKPLNRDVRYNFDMKHGPADKTYALMAFSLHSPSEGNQQSSTTWSSSLSFWTIIDCRSSSSTACQITFNQSNLF